MLHLRSQDVNTAKPPARDWAPASPRWHKTGILALAVALVLVELAARKWSGDAFWQLAAGHWMIRHHAVLRRNIFSWDLAGKPWINIEWGYDVLLALVMGGGPRFGYAFAALLAALTFSGFYRLARVAGADRGRAAWLMGAASVLTLPFWDYRPQIVAYPLAVWFLAWVWEDRRAGRVPWRALPLVLIWANVHGSWILAPVWGALEMGLAFMKRDNGRALLPWVAALMAVGFINPWGPAGVYHALWLSINGHISHYIGEWLPPDFHLPQVGLLLLPAILIPPAVAARAGVRDLRRWIYWGGCLLASLWAVRFAPYLGIGLIALLGAGSAAPMPRAFARGALGLSLVFALWAAYLLPGANAPATAWVNRAYEPVGAVAWLKSRGLTHRVFGMYSWGGYLAANGIRDWIDGRADFFLMYGRHFQDYEAARWGQKSGPALMAQAGARVALVEIKSPLYQQLELAGWPRLYRGRIAAVFAVERGSHHG